MPSSPKSPLSTHARTPSLPDNAALSSSPRVSSPLNPASASTPTQSNVALSPTSDSDDDIDFPEFPFAARGQNPSSMREMTQSSPSITVSRSAAESAPTSAVSLPTHLGNTLRGRSKSPPEGHGEESSRSVSPAPSAHLSASWWGDHGRTHTRPWIEPPQRKQTLSSGQAEGYEHTRKRVAQAVHSVLGTVAEVTYELLFISVELLDLAPVPGLAPAAKTLLNIWDAVQKIDMNRLGCLRLTERCAEILLSVRQEVHEAGDTVGIELAVPLEKLDSSFANVYTFLQKQIRRPFLKRYLKRDEILRDINECDTSLRDALSLFGLSIQIRILKQVQETERRRHAEMQALLNTVLNGGRIVASEATSDPLRITTGQFEIEGEASLSALSLDPDESSETVTRFTTTTNALGLSEPTPSTPLNLHPDRVLPTLANLHQTQNSLDSALDLADLRQLMRMALLTTSDAEMLNVLGVGQQEMPDAIKTLQRALEKVLDRQGSLEGVEAIPPGVVMGKVIRTVSVKDPEPSEGGLKRSKTVISIESSSSSTSGGGSSGSGSKKKDTLDQEFIESGISALMRMSRGLDTNLPSWTITKYEVDRERRIGVGGFSSVYKGTWRGRTVAIKVLALTTPRNLFVREVGIWKTLKHPHVLELFGASSASGEPPWFFVSAYEKNGNLVDYLKKVEQDLRPTAAAFSSLPAGKFTRGRTATVPSPFKPGNGVSPLRESTLGPPPRGRTPPGETNGEVRREWDLFRFMHEIAKGVEYLHSCKVLHGDMKAANVLVDDYFRCVITDFGQSEMKSEAFRLSGKQPPQGTLRWQAPELLAGGGELTHAVDVYAFAIACSEIVNMGRVPWSLVEDEIVRQIVLKENGRPSLNANSRFNTPGLQEILRLCWHRDPAFRPPFSKIVRDFKLLRKNFGHEEIESPKGPLPALVEEHPPASPSPDMRPIPLPPLTPPYHGIIDWSSGQRTHKESTVATEDIKMPEPVFFTSAPNAPEEQPDPEEEGFDIVDLDGWESIAPADDRIAAMKNEMRYRFLLTHDFHPSLIVPLWEPSPVELGSVGFLNKPRGEFVSLFNSLSPEKAGHPLIRRLPSLHGYGKVDPGSHRQDKRNAAQRGIDTFIGLLTRNKNDGVAVSRRYTFPLKAGHKAAHLCTETTEYRYIPKLDAPRKWFQAHIDAIMQVYGHDYHIQKEEVFLVIGLLRTPNYGLFVSHNHPDGHAHFNVYASPKVGQPWGTFTTDMLRNEPGPSYDDSEGVPDRVEASKVSDHGGPWDTVLIARLRFKPDVAEPTTK